MMNPHSFKAARQQAGLDRDELAARAATIGHRWHSTHAPYEERGPLREDLEAYIRHAELGDVADQDDPWFLPPTHPYVKWLAEALNTTPLRLIDTPLALKGGRPR